MAQRFLRMMLIVLFAYALVSLFLPDPSEKNPLSQGDIGIQMSDSTVVQGNLVKVVVQNNLETEFLLGETQFPPENLIFEHKKNGRWERLSSASPEQIDEPFVLAPGERQELSFAEFNTELFFEEGSYRAIIRPEEGQEFEANFEVSEPGFFRSLFRAIYKIIYNTFILFLMIGLHDLGLAIILVTLFTKLALWGVNKHSLESQQKMQKLQPELKRIKEKYKNDQQKMAMETMAIWKKHKISPMAAFTPLLIQFPVLIALFYVIRDGLAPNNQFLLYPPFRDFDFGSINEVFLGLFDLSLHPLADMSLIWLPFVVGISQFFAMKLAFARQQRRKEQQRKSEKNSSSDTSKDATPSLADQMESMSKMMQYVLPVMIFFFTLTFPAGVGLYWWISTLIGMGQQYLVNRKLEK